MSDPDLRGVGKTRLQEPAEASPIGIRDLARRIADSPTFERSAQLRTLLIGLCDAVAEGRSSEITEGMIGESILKRRQFDPSTDTIVRVQVRRLRRKLDEYYRNEGAEDAIRLEIPKFGYAPALKVAPLSQPQVQQPEPPKRETERFWLGFSTATVVMGVLFASLLPALKTPARGRAPHPAIAESPFWRGFIHAKPQPILALSSPLFFRTRESYVRDFRLNFQEDLQYASTLIGNRLAVPCWNKFVSIFDIKTLMLLEPVLASSGHPAVVKSARELTSRELQQSPIIFLGHPRGSPHLLELLSELPFYVRRTSAGQPLRGIVNRSPRGGEKAEYVNENETDMEIWTNNRPDYVLVTLIHRPSGASILSVFGNRYESSHLVMQLLTDESYLTRLRSRLTTELGSAWEKQGVQVLFQVPYLEGNPLQAEFLTCRKTERLMHVSWAR